MDLAKSDWHTKASVPDAPGWYFIRTNTPVAVLTKQVRPFTHYRTKKKNLERPTKNYDIAARADRFTENLKDYWNLTEVYSGIATSLLSRAREHTIPDAGTAGLALGHYPALRAYKWTFHYFLLDELEIPAVPARARAIMLRLGEQAWRAENGWPLLCSG